MKTKKLSLVALLCATPNSAVDSALRGLRPDEHGSIDASYGDGEQERWSKTKFRMSESIFDDIESMDLVKEIVPPILDSVGSNFEGEEEYSHGSIDVVSGEDDREKLLEPKHGGIEGLIEEIETDLDDVAIMFEEAKTREDKQCNDTTEDKFYEHIRDTVTSQTYLNMDTDLDKISFLRRRITQFTETINVCNITHTDSLKALGELTDFKNTLENAENPDLIDCDARAKTKESLLSRCDTLSDADVHAQVRNVLDSKIYLQIETKLNQVCFLDSAVKRFQGVIIRCKLISEDMHNALEELIDFVAVLVQDEDDSFSLDECHPCLAKEKNELKEKVEERLKAAKEAQRKKKEEDEKKTGEEPEEETPTKDNSVMGAKMGVP